MTCMPIRLFFSGMMYKVLLFSEFLSAFVNCANLLLKAQEALIIVYH